MPVRELFHLMHMVDDFDPADQFFTELFAPVVMMPKGWSDFDKRWASIGLVGSDFSFELMEASKDDADQGAPLPKFARRFGQHLHSLAFYVDPDDMPALVDRLLERNVRVVRPDGSEFVAGEVGDVPRTIFTHGRDTCGQLEFQARNPHDPRFAANWSDTYWREDHPLGIQRMSHVTVVVSDLERAGGIFAGALGGVPFHASDDDGAERAYILVGTETVVELVEPRHADSRWGRELARNGELPNEVTFIVRELDGAERHVEKIGARVDDRSPESFTIDPADAFGAVLTFTTRRIPGDPRP